MAGTLLATKLYIPLPRPGAVARPRLLARLDAGLACPLTLISAPAGFGKTTLLGRWIAARRAEPAAPAFAWLSLDERDDDPARFLTYCIAALQTVAPETGATALALLQSPQRPSLETLLVPLLNDLAQAASPLPLVLDDYHAVEAQGIHDTLAFLLDRLPPHVHLIVAGRADPPLPLARLRARAQLVELRAADLRFTPQETADFLNGVMGLALSPAAIDNLAARTEGWIAGMQLAAVSLQGREDREEFVRVFSGSHRHVLDYLLEEVLKRQPENVQSFLLQTSILDRLTAPLCDAVLDAPAGSQAALEQLERANLFMVPLDDERRWYRYHRLFADLLRQYLEKTQPEKLPELHRRAGGWLERHEWLPEAIEHAFAAGDAAHAADLVERAAEGTFMRSEVGTLLRWLNALPDEHIRSRPILCIYHAWALMLMGQPRAAVLARLDDAEAGASAGAIPAEAAVCRALLATLLGDTSRSLTLSREALARLPEENGYWRGIVMSNLGMAHVLVGDIDAAIQAFDESVRLGRIVGNTLFAVGALGNLGGLCLLRGRLRQAESIYGQALDLATDAHGRRLPVATRALFGLAELARERNDLDTAARYLAECLELSEQYGEIGTLVTCVSLARVRQEQGDAAGAQAMIERARQLAQRSEATSLDDQLVAVAQARLSIRQGDLAAAEEWARERKRSGMPAAYDLQEAERTLLARLHLAQGRAREALETLAPLREAAERRGRARRLVEILALEALSHHAQGDERAALAAMEQLLRLAEPEGYVRVFLDGGAPMARLLSAVLARGISADYARRLLAQFPAAPHAAAPAEEAPALIEPLSAREREVLGLIAEGLSNQEIAERLVISLSTVKGHAAAIFGKLGVSHRTQAVARARELGLLG